MTNDIEMLNCVLQNAEMGCQGITSVRKSLKDSKVDGAATKALPASFPSYLAKFLTNLAARSFAFSSHSEASAYVSRGSRIPDQHLEVL